MVNFNHVDESRAGKYKTILIGVNYPAFFRFMCIAFAILAVTGCTKTDLVRSKITESTRLRVRSGGNCCGGSPQYGQTLFETEDTEAIEKFSEQISLSVNLLGWSCGCCGDMTFDLYKGQDLHYSFSLHHGSSIRIKGASTGDESLSFFSRGELSKWLDQNGVIEALAKMKEDEAERRRLELENTKNAIANLLGAPQNSKDKNTKESTLPVSVTMMPTASIDPKLKVLGLRVVLGNYSDGPIQVSAAHEWHGGIWNLTDVYALVSPSDAKLTRRFHPVYVAGESQEITKPTIIASKKSVPFVFRMDWPGTGSCPTSPLMVPAKSNEYKVKFLILFEAQGLRQYVISPETTVKLKQNP
jgi:hypothetical protein